MDSFHDQNAESDTMMNMESAPLTHDADKQLINRLMRDAKIPGWAEDAYSQLNKDREYVHTEGMANKPDQVGVNYVLRCIYAKQAQIAPEKPSFAAEPRRMVNPALIESLQTAAPQIIAERKILEAHAETSAALVSDLFNEADGPKQFDEASLDALTCGIAFLKVTWQEDPTRDPAGNHRIGDDAQDQAIRLRRLAMEYEAGEFAVDSEQMSQFQDLTRYMVEVARISGNPELAALATQDPNQPAKSFLLPEPEVWKGVRIDLVLPENLRLDWGRITNATQMYHGRRTIERVWMSRDEITERYSLTIEEKHRLGGQTTDAISSMLGAPSSEAVQMVAAGLDATVRGQEVAFYECWDRETRTMYQWAAGLDRFLNRETPSIVNRRFFPYVPVSFNTASNRFLPLSEVAITRPLQDEINQRLTNQREHMRARHPRYLAQKGIMDDEEKAKLESGNPHQVIEVNGNPEDIAKKIVALQGAPLDPRDYDVSQLMRLIEVQMGLPTASLGQSRGASLATEITIANDHAQAQSSRHGQELVKAMQIAGEMILDYAAAALSPADVRRRLGPTAVWPISNREQIARGLNLELTAHGSDRSARRQGIENMHVAAQALSSILDLKQRAAQVGLSFDVESLINKVLSDSGIRKPAQDLIKEMPMLPPEPAAPQS